jgi:hypothetical protein
MQPTAASAVPVVRTGKPDGVNAAVWIVIVLSALLAWNAFGLLAAGAVTEKVQQMQAQMESRMRVNGPRAEFDRMLQHQREIMAAARPDFAMPVGVLALVVAVAGIVFAIRLNKRRADALVWFQSVAIAIVVLEVVSIFQGLQVQRRIQPLMTEMMNSMANLPHGQHAERVEPVMKMMNTAMAGVSMMTLVFTVGWGLAKIAVCIFARHRAGSSAVRAWLSSG